MHISYINYMAFFTKITIHIVIFLTKFAEKRGMQMAFFHFSFITLALECAGQISECSFGLTSIVQLKTFVSLWNSDHCLCTAVKRCTVSDMAFKNQVKRGFMVPIDNTSLSMLKNSFILVTFYHITYPPIYLRIPFCKRWYVGTPSSMPNRMLFQCYVCKYIVTLSVSKLQF